MKLLNFSNATIAASCLVTIASSSSCNKDKQTEKPNIIIVLADAQGWGDMAYNGHTVLHTLNFDDMARSGLRFDRFYAAAPLSSPTRGSIMTGRHPNRFGCLRWGNTLRPQEITLAQALKTGGYVTGHFGKWHLGPVYKGSPVNPGASGFDEWFSAPNFYVNDPILSREGIAVQTRGESSIVTVDTAIEFIRNSKGSQPFFAYVCFGSPHRPHIAHEQDGMHYLFLEERFQDFYGEITGMDRAVGKLRDELREMGIDENTILWYMSDNGGLWEVGSTGGRGNKGSIYEGGLRVPAILEWPARIKKPIITNIPCNTSDIYPTLLEIAGVKLNNQPVLDGIGLVPLFDNRMEVRGEPMGFWQYPGGGQGIDSHQIMLELLEKQQAGVMEVVDSSKLQLDAGDITRQYPEDILPGHSAWLDWPYKLHRIHRNSGEITLELYNLEEDPWEETDLLDKDINRVNSMKSELEKWQLSVIKSLNGEDYLSIK